MPSTLYLATELNALAEKLAAQVDESNRVGDFFAPVRIVVPHRALSKWLRCWLARRQGVAINFHIDFQLEKTIWQLLRDMDGRDHPIPLQLLDENDYRTLVLVALLEENPNKSADDALRAYLGTKSDSGQRNYWRRAWQLAGRLAGLIRDYEYHRQDALIQPWLKMQDAYANSNSSDLRLERSQREMFQQIIEEKAGLRTRLGQSLKKNCKTLPQYAMELMELPAEQLKTPAAATLHLFGIGQISSLHVTTLNWLGQWYDLRLYHLNPLAGHWQPPARATSKIRESLQDVANGYRDPAPRKGQRGLGEELLAIWGLAGAESLHLMADLLKGKKPLQVEKVCAENRPAATSVLTHLQAQLLGPTPAQARLPQDTSMQIVACPGIYREVETAYQSILHNLQQDDNLRQTDIAILVSDMTQYRPVIQAVFDRSPGRVRYTLADYSAAELSSFGHAVVGLLDLALESFTRSRVFAVFLNPCFLARMKEHGVDREQVLHWLAWAEELGVYHGWDSKDKKERGYAASPLYSWQLGLRRLRLGRLMDVACEQDGTPATHFQNVIPFADLVSGDKEQLNAFCLAVEGLLPRLARLRNLTTSGQRWASELRQLIDDCLAVPEDRLHEEGIRGKLFQSLDQLAVLDRVRGENSTGGLPLPLIREFVEGNLETLKATTGEFLTGGVTVSALQPVLPIPFRIIYLLGMGEGLFPGSNRLARFDLRSRQRSPGDIHPAEANRYLFLQALLAAREKVYLLYDCRDLQKDQHLHPCSPVNQLRRCLEEHVVDGNKFHVTDVPLLGSSQCYLCEGANADVTDCLVNYSPSDRLMALEEAASRTMQLTGKQKDELKRRSDKARLVFQLPSSARAADGKIPTISVNELYRFLLCPAEAALGRHLNLKDEEETEVEDDEPFQTPGNDYRILLRETLHHFVLRAGAQGLDEALRAWPAHFAAFHEEWSWRGRVPDGAFGQVDRVRIEQAIRDRIENPNGLANFLRGREQIQCDGPILLGESNTPQGAKVRFPALSLALTPNASNSTLSEVRLVASQPMIWRGQKSVDVLVITTSNKKRDNGDQLDKLLLKPALFWLALKAGLDTVSEARDWLGERTFRIHIAHEEGIVAVDYDHRDISNEEARDYLAALASDFLDQNCFDLLPFELIVKDKILQSAYLVGGKNSQDSTQSPQGEQYVQAVLDAREQDQEKQRPDYWAMKLLDIVEAKVPTDAYDKVRRRFQILDRGPAKNRKDSPRGK